MYEDELMKLNKHTTAKKVIDIMERNYHDQYAIEFERDGRFMVIIKSEMISTQIIYDLEEVFPNGASLQMAENCLKVCLDMRVIL